MNDDELTQFHIASLKFWLAKGAKEADRHWNAKGVDAAMAKPCPECGGKGWRFLNHTDNGGVPVNGVTLCRTCNLKAVTS